MSIVGSQVKTWVIPQGDVSRVMDSAGRIIWQKVTTPTYQVGSVLYFDGIPFTIPWSTPPLKWTVSGTVCVALDTNGLAERGYGIIGGSDFLLNVQLDSSRSSATTGEKYNTFRSGYGFTQDTVEILCNTGGTSSATATRWTNGRSSSSSVQIFSNARRSPRRGDAICYSAFVGSGYASGSTVRYTPGRLTVRAVGYY